MLTTFHFDILTRLCSYESPSSYYGINKSFNESIIPKYLKVQSIAPVFKKVDQAQASNYRPISLVYHLIKIFERVVRAKLVSYLESNKLHSSSINMASGKDVAAWSLMKHSDNVLQSILNGNEHYVVYLDFAEAFDKVDREDKNLGIQGKLLA